MPINLDEIGPWPDVKMSTEAEAPGSCPAWAQPRPLAHARMKSVGPDDPSASYRLAAHDDAGGIYSVDPGVPKRRNPGLVHAVNLELVQRGSGDPETVQAWM